MKSGKIEPTEIITEAELTIKEVSSTDTPASGYQVIYPKTDGSWYVKDDAGVESALGGGVGVYRTVYIDAAAMVPAITNPPEVDNIETTTNKVNYDSLNFAGTSGSADEIAWFKLAMPDEWDRNTVKVKIYWEPDTGASVSDNVRFTIAGGAISNDDAIDTAVGTAVNVDDVVIAVGDLHVSPASGAITIAGTPALGDLVFFKLTRDYDYTGGGTGMAEDAKLLGISLQYKESTTSPSGW